MKPARLLVIIQTHKLISMLSDRRQPSRSINIHFTPQTFKEAFLECRLGINCNEWVIRSPIAENTRHQLFVAKLKRFIHYGSKSF